jgi:acyl dehydratase
VPLTLFDDFVPQAVLGRHEEEIGPAVLRPWQALFPGMPIQAPLPPGVSVALVVRAYMAILRERPAGNIHTRQRMQFHRGLVPGERVVTELTCIGKELRRERRWVHFRTETTGISGGMVCVGEMSMLWAK